MAIHRLLISTNPTDLYLRNLNMTYRNSNSLSGNKHKPRAALVPRNKNITHIENPIHRPAMSTNPAGLHLLSWNNTYWNFHWPPGNEYQPSRDAECEARSGHGTCVYPPVLERPEYCWSGKMMGTRSADVNFFFYLSGPSE